VNGMDWPGHVQKHSTPKLYHNNHDGTFTDVTHKAGLDVEMFGMGVAVVTTITTGLTIFSSLRTAEPSISQQRQRHVHGCHAKAGLLGPREFSTSAAWVDYDKDGHLDLVVGNYVQWTPETDLYCTLDGKSKSYCTPESYKGTSVRLCTIAATAPSRTQPESRPREPTSKTLGVAVLDFDNDGWPDLLFSNDTQPNKLLSQ